MVGILIGAYLLLLLVLNFGPTHRAITQMAAHVLSEKLGTTVVIGNLEIGLFNRVILSDVRIDDLHHTPLLQAQRMTAKIELRSLLRDQLALRAVSLLDTDVRLYRPSPDQPDNFQFLIDAFASKDNKPSSGVNLRINSIILRRVNVGYHQLYVARTPGIFNPSHLQVNQVNANISLKSINRDGLKLRVRSLSFRESSGFQLDNLCLKLDANRHGAVVRDFEWSMPHSRVSQSDLTLLYDATSGWERLLPTLRVQGNLSGAQIDSDDLKSLLKLPQGLHVVSRFSTAFLVNPSRIQLNSLDLSANDDGFRLQGDLVLLRSNRGITDLTAHLASLQARSQFLTSTVSAFMPDTLWLQRLVRAGDLSAKGFLHHHVDGHGNAKLSFESNVGRLATDAYWTTSNLDASVHVRQLQPARFFADNRYPQQADIDAHLAAGWNDAHRLTSARAQVTLERLNYNGRFFQPIRLFGALDGSTVRASIQSTDPSARLHANATMQLHGQSMDAARVEATVEKFCPNLVGLSGKLSAASYQGTVIADLHGLSRRALPMGHVSVSKFRMDGGPLQAYLLDHLKLDLHPHSDGAELSMESDFADARITGSLVPSDFTRALCTIAQKALPGLLPAPKTPYSGKWSLLLQLRKTDVLKQFLGMNVDLESPLWLQGIFDSGSGRSHLSLTTDGVDYDGNTFKHVSLFLHGNDSTYKALLQLQKDFGGYPYKLEANLATIRQALQLSVGWKGMGTPHRYEGEINTHTSFYPSKSGRIDFLTHIRPTQFLLADTVWHVSSGSFSSRNQELTISNVCLSRPGQSLSVDGRLSKQSNDSIVAHLKNIDVAYILGIVDFDAVEFGGLATGDAVFLHTPEHPMLHARIHLPDFRFNKGPMGAADIAANWNSTDKRINLDADMTLHEGRGGTKVKGYVSPAEKGLDLSITAKRTDLRFLNRYIDGIFGEFGGDATGHVRLHGPFKQLDFEGEVKANAHARVLSTGVFYDVTEGDVRMVPGAFQFNKFKVSDRVGGKGTANGELRHTHLKKLNYAFDLTAEHLLCYDSPAGSGMPFKSTTYASGNVHLQGWPSHFVADINLRPEAGTTLVYDLGTQEAATIDNTMVHFHAMKEPANDASLLPSLRSDAKETIKEDEPSEPGTDIQLNLLLDMNPKAQVQIVTDPKSGDNLTLYGSGPIRASFHNKGAFEMYGTYVLERGTYKLSIQDIIRKDLNIQPGSRLIFAGNPMSAALDMQAKYTVNSVSLSDLNYGAGFGQKSVKVDCLLNITGKAGAPAINFDLDLHNISEDEKQMVRQLISTDEDMNRQIIYLLGVGRFYTASTSGSLSQVSSQQQSSAAMRSFLSTTLTGQLNSAISNVLGNNSHWSFGTNVAPGTTGWNDIEVGGLLEGRLFNDRLLINGNFGYRDRPTYASNFVGDFDIRYLLTPRGNISLRAYSETTDRYFTKSALTTQGIGLMLQRNFQKFTDLFVPQRKRKRAKGNEATF